MPPKTPQTFDSSRMPREKRLESYSRFVATNPKLIMPRHQILSIDSDTPEMHRIDRMFGEDIWVSRVETTGHAIQSITYPGRPKPSRQFVVCLMREGNSELVFDQGRQVVRAGDVAIYATDINRLTVGPGVATRMLFPDQCGIDIGSIRGKATIFPGSTPLGKLLASTISSVEDTLFNTHELAADNPLSQIAKQTVRYLLLRERTTDSTTPTARTRERVRGFVLENLSDTTLSPKTISEFLGMSRAALYRTFAADGGVMAFVMDIRMDVAQSLLASSYRKRGGVNEVAYLSGFKSPSHFTQAFKRAFGKAPSRHMDISAREE